MFNSVGNVHTKKTEEYEGLLFEILYTLWSSGRAAVE